MNTITVTKLYDLLSTKLDKETAENLTTFIESKIQHLATKEDVAKVDLKISETKSEIIKWMFIFWVGQVVVTFGFLLIYLKK